MILCQEWSKSYLELIASYVHPKNSNNLWSLRAIMALDHRRLIRPGKKLRPNFLRSTTLLYEILPTNLGACKPTFHTIYTSHLRWNSTMKNVFIIQTLDRMQYSTILQYKLHSFNIQDDRSTRGLFKKFPRSPIPGAPNDNFRKNICSEDDLRSRIFGTFVVKFLACLPLLGFSNI